MRIQIPSHVEYIIGKLNQNGYEAFAVGGCVRDTLLGRTPDVYKRQGVYYIENI